MSYDVERGEKMKIVVDVLELWSFKCAKIDFGNVYEVGKKYTDIHLLIYVIAFEKDLLLFANK